MSHMTVTYLHHSGVVIETPSVQLVFDPITPHTELLNAGKPVIYCITHGHGDHFVPSVYTTRERHGTSVYYVLSDDVSGHPQAPKTVLPIAPGKSLSLGSVDIRAFDSTDLGVSFLISVDGLNLFHSGDLNWWHWANDTPEVQAQEAAQYKGILSDIVRFLAAGQDHQTIDLACVPLDPRLGAAAHYAFEYFLEVLSPKYALPLHFDGKYDVLRDIMVRRGLTDAHMLRPTCDAHRFELDV